MRGKKGGENDSVIIVEKREVGGLKGFIGMDHSHGK